MGSEGDEGARRGAQELLGSRGRMEEGEPPSPALYPSIMPTGYPSFEPGPLQECAPPTSRRLGMGVVELEWGCPRGGISQALGAEAGVLAWEGLVVRPTLLASVPLSSSTQSPLVTQGSEHPTPPTQATGITEELYRRTYTFCTRLLTLPAPYCTVALDCAIRLKTETAVPGKSCPRKKMFQVRAAPGKSCPVRSVSSENLSQVKAAPGKSCPR